MNYTITLRDQFVEALNQMVTETTGMDATAIVRSIVEGYLSPVMDRITQATNQAKLAAFELAAPTATKAEIIASVSPKIIVTK